MKLILKCKENGFFKKKTQEELDSPGLQESPASSKLPGSGSSLKNLSADKGEKGSTTSIFQAVRDRKKAREITQTGSSDPEKPLRVMELQLDEIFKVVRKEKVISDEDVVRLRFYLTTKEQANIIRIIRDTTELQAKLDTFTSLYLGENIERLINLVPTIAPEAADLLKVGIYIEKLYSGVLSSMEARLKVQRKDPAVLALLTRFLNDRTYTFAKLK